MHREPSARAGRFELPNVYGGDSAALYRPAFAGAGFSGECSKTRRGPQNPTRLSQAGIMLVAPRHRSSSEALEAVNAASKLEDLSIPPGNRLEKLKGDLKDFHSIRINDQWRIIFRWVNGEPYDVKIVDYH